MRPCPTDTDLLLLALAPAVSTPSGDAIARHVTECPRCREELSGLRESLAGLRGSEPGLKASTACLDDDAVASLAEGLAGRARLPAELTHLAECGECRERVAAVSGLLRASEVSSLVRGLDAPAGRRDGWRRRLLLAGGVAAAAIVVLAVRGSGGAALAGIRLREAPIALISAPVPVQPAGLVARADSFSWHSVQRATQYRVTLFSEEGATVWDTGTTDTVVVLPSGVRLAPSAVYYWKVEARTDWNRWTTSEMVEIRIGGHP